jgi:hypothetical protein
MFCKRSLELTAISYREAVDAFYSNTAFEFAQPDIMECFLRSLHPHRFSNISHLELHWTHKRDMSFHRYVKPGPLGLFIGRTRRPELEPFDQGVWRSACFVVSQLHKLRSLNVTLAFNDLDDFDTADRVISPLWSINCCDQFTAFFILPRYYEEDMPKLRDRWALDRAPFEADVQCRLY